MPMKRSLIPILPGQIRSIPRSFGWIDHRLRSTGLLEQLEPEDIGLYLFLVLAADKQGLACWRLDRMERMMPCFTRAQLWNARDRLQQLRLVRFKPWRKGDPDGLYQVLPLPET